MTTFERFQRDARSRLNSNSKSLKKKSAISSDSTLRRLVSFSARDILFLYQTRRKFATFSLIMKNLTGNKIYFKVRSNNSKSYIVIPYEEVIPDQGEIIIKFQFIPSEHGLQTHRKDKFQIIWGKVSHNPNQPTTMTQSMIFPVTIEKVGADDSAQEQMGNGIFGPNFAKDQRLPIKDYGPSPTVSQSIPNFQHKREKNYQQKSQNFQKIEKTTLSSTNENTLLTKNNLIIVSIVAFIFGFLLT